MMIYFGLNEDEQDKIDHIAIINSYDEYDEHQYLETDDFTIIYSVNKFALTNWMEGFQLEVGIDFIIEDEKEVIEFILLRYI